MITKPLLILAFNRPLHVKGLIDSLRPHRPQKILVSIDGPRRNNEKDKQKINLVLAEVKKIDWTEDVQLRVREKNLGLRFAVIDAVTWAISKYGEVIVVEDDVEVGPDFLQFMSNMLDEYRDDFSIGHISGYTSVPRGSLLRPDDCTRLSRIPASYAWATWGRAWKLYDDQLNWAAKVSIKKLRNLVGTWSGAIVWKINYFDARKLNIDTWAYRWLFTLWKHELYSLTPNTNLVAYKGHATGTHTRSKPRIPELPIVDFPTCEKQPAYDLKADEWLHKSVFRGTIPGVLRRIAESAALSLIRLKK